MKKILAIFTTVMLLGCTTNHDEVVVTMKSVKSTAISKEQALKNLYGELKLLYGETRTDGSQRTVKSIKPLKGAITRSGNALDNDLLYIVEFEEGQGSAVLAADTRLKPVIAVLDSDVFTAQDFASDDMEDISVYMASLITDYAEGAASVASVGLLPAPGHTVVDTIYYSNIPPMLKTKWHQESPYNDLCLLSNGDTTVAGCAAIAIAQFAYYHKSPDTINGYDVDWELLSNCEYGAMQPTDFNGGLIGGGTIGGGLIGDGLIGGGNISFDPYVLAKAEVANFVYNIGIAIGLDYTSGSVGASIYQMDNCLYRFGYECTLMQYSSYAAKNIVSNDKPVIVVGFNSVGFGHAWLIDGWKECIIRTTTALPLPEGPVGSVEPEYEITEVYFNRIHCNFGWDGKCDGYYNGDVFDCRYENEYIEPGIGDKPTARPGVGYYFNTDLYMYSY